MLYNYKYNGKELQETGMYSYGWREYMPDIGRWNGMDQLSESYSSASPYAYVLNNPVNMIDPDGRFSMQTFTSNIMSFASGTTFSNNNDGSWSINGSSMAVDDNGTLIKGRSAGIIDIPGLTLSGSSINRFFTRNYFSSNNKQSTFSHLDKYIGSMPTISEWQMDTVEKWANSDNIALKFAYGIANNAYVTAQIFDFGLLERPEWKNPLGGNYGNLDGTPNYKQADAFINTTLTLAPYARGAVAARATIPEGIVLLDRFNSKGTVYNVLNKGIDYVNKDLGKGMKSLPFAKTIGNMAQPDSSFRKWIKRNVGYKSEFY